MTEQFTITPVSSDAFAKDVDGYIRQANTEHQAFKLSGASGEAIVLARADFDAWQETIHLLSNQANAQALLEAIAELDRK
jgi:antitoxin YefM